MISNSGFVRSFRRSFWWVIAIAALIGGTATLAGALPTRTANAGVLSQAHVSAHASSPKLAATKRSRPMALRIPAIGVSSKVGKLGLQPNGEVMVPTTIHTVGWYIDGPAPGQLGSSVILGHVDSYAGAGVFFDLKLLKAGDKITVTSRDGVTTQFVVTKVVEYSKNSFPDQIVYGPHGTRSLQLVTCGGVFDHATGHYKSNIVVFSNLVKVTASKTA